MQVSFQGGMQKWLIKLAVCHQQKSGLDVKFAS